MERQGKSNFTVVISDKHHLSQVIEVNPDSNKHFNSLYTFNTSHKIRMALPPQNPQPQSNYEKNIRQISTEGHPTKYLTGTLQIYLSHQKHF